MMKDTDFLDFEMKSMQPDYSEDDAPAEGSSSAGGSAEGSGGGSVAKNGVVADTIDRIKQQNKLRKSILTTKRPGEDSDDSEYDYGDEAYNGGSEDEYGNGGKNVYDDDDDDDDDEKKYSDGSSIASHPSENESLLETSKNNWDIFINRPWMNDHELDEKHYRKYRRGLLIVTYIIIFSGILIFSILSKASFLMAVGNVRAPLVDRQSALNYKASSLALTDLYRQADDIMHTMSLGNISAFYNSSLASEEQYKMMDNFQNFLACFNYTAKRRYKIQEGNETWYEVHTIMRTRCISLSRHYSYNLSDLSCLNEANLPHEPYYVNYSAFPFPDNPSIYGSTTCLSFHLSWIWSIFLMLTIPIAAVFVSSVWKFFFKPLPFPRKQTLIIFCIIETIHTAALSFIAFYILPSMDDAIQAIILLTGIAIIPACLAVINKPVKLRKIDSQAKRAVCAVVNVLALLAQLSVPGILTWKSYTKKEADPILYCSIAPALFFFSLRWWENYHGERSARFAPIVGLARLVSRMKKCRPATMLFSCPLKVMVHFGMLLVCVHLQISKIAPLGKHSWTSVLQLHYLKCNRWEINGFMLPTMATAWSSMWTLNVVSGFLIYFFSTVAAKIKIQQIALAIPITLSVPATAAFLVGGCELWNDNPCSLKSDYFFMEYFYKCYDKGTFVFLLYDQLYCLIPVWWLSLLWVTRHIWYPQSQRLAKSNRLYMHPLFEATVAGESILLNRNRNDALIEIENRAERAKKLSHNPNGTILGTGRKESLSGLSMMENNQVDELVKNMRTDTTPYIYICATMWHEEREEMVEMMKSIFRLDKDQAARRNVQLLGLIEPDYYEFEAHIFFDNAMENHDDPNKDYTANEYVVLLVEVLREAAKGVHDVLARVDDPIKTPTAYGGRLQWTLPGENTLTVHLKDSAKIRHKKRWSQVMYMYYFLGFRLCADDTLSSERKLTRSVNTYMLALDGDVDFEPLALILLVDLMKRSEKVGAVCGRIHPVGNGPLVWYQEFEYALGHWLQKAAEHVLGCVLCSPGCFSLFRASALMDENVMRMYTKIPKEPREHIQYDQGEDRWLCTLLLQQGYRVEYCAASDSYTHCPVGFFEFFTQRRRWMPSTMANILSLIESRKHTVSVNENISSLYVFYQAAILLASLLSPGIIFMMMVGALNASLESWNQTFSPWGMAGLNAMPIVIFIILCFRADNNLQLWFASCCAALYIVVQLLVLVGTAVTMYNNNICHSTTVFFLSLTFLFIFSGVIHPQEFHCVCKGIIYYVSIPTMYMLLMIYAILNLHVISWGTREVKKSSEEMEEDEKRKMEGELKKMEEEAKQKGLVFDLLQNVRKKTSSLMLAKGKMTCDSLCSIICCSKPQPVTEKSAIDDISMRLSAIEMKLDIKGVQRRKSMANGLPTIIDMTRGSVYADDQNVMNARGSVRDPNILLELDENDLAPDYSDNDSISTLILKRSLKKKSKMPRRDELRNPSWIEDERLGEGRIEFLDEEEGNFFKDLIKTYLKPLLKDQATEEQSARELLDLRNSVGLVFLFANAAFVLVAFFMQFNVTSVYIPWPCTLIKTEGNKEGGAVLNQQFSKVDPLGFGFLVLFGMCLFVQFTSMLVHRFNTFLHIMSTTKLRRSKELNMDDPEGMVQLVQQMGNLGEYEPDYDDDDGDGSDSDSYDPGKKTYRANFMEKTMRVKSGHAKQTIKEAFLSRLDKLETMNQQYGAEEFVRRASRMDDLGLGKEFKTAAALMTLRHKLMTVRQGNLPDQSVFSNRDPAKNTPQDTHKPRMYTPHTNIVRNNRKPSVTQYNHQNDSTQPPRYGFNY